MFSKTYTMVFVVGVTMVSALVLATAATALKPRQELNARLDKMKSILKAMALVKAGEALTGEELEKRFQENVELVFVDYRGTVDSAYKDPKHNQDKLLKNLGLAEKLPAGIPDKKGLDTTKGIEKLRLIVYVQKSRPGGSAAAYVIPLLGRGLWGPIHGYLCLDGKDLNTVTGVIFLTEKETPGLGKEIEKPKFQEQFKGKLIFDENGLLRSIRVIKGKVDPTHPDARHQVDGVSGATITCNSVTKMLRKDLFLYAPYFRKLRGSDGTKP